MKLHFQWIRQQARNSSLGSGALSARRRRRDRQLSAEVLEDRRLLAATIHEFPIPTPNAFPVGIASGPDGNLWFAQSDSNAIGRITPTGTISAFPTTGGGPAFVTGGPDGNVWFTEENGKGLIGRITPSGTTTFFPVPTQSPGLEGITLGPDGNLWFTESLGAANKIGRITPSGVVTEFSIPTPDCRPTGIAAGPDGALWFTESAGNFSGQVAKIGRITTSGTITEFSIPTANAAPTAITAGPDGNLWFVEGGANEIGRITPAGSIAEFPIPTPTSGAGGITAGPDGNLYFGEENKIGRITTGGAVTEFLIAGGAQVEAITAGPDGNIWFTEAIANSIGQLVLTPAVTAPDLALSGEAPAAVALGSTATYNLTLTNNGTAVATGVKLTDTLPAGVTFVSATNGVSPANGVLTFGSGNLDPAASVHFSIVVSPKAPGTLEDLARVSMNQTDPTPADDSVTLTTVILRPNVVTDGPTVTSVRLRGSCKRPATLVLTFDEPLDPARAQSLANYQIVALAGAGRLARIKTAVYDAGGRSVTLRFARRLNLHRRFRLTVIGTGPIGVADTSGNLLDGADNGQAGSNFVLDLSAGGQVRPANRQPAPTAPSDPGRYQRQNR
jgi:virginiamycin B lyase